MEDLKDYTIKFFYFDKLLGEFDCPGGTNQDDRNKIATDHGIDNWTHFILGLNQIMGVRLNEVKHDRRGEMGKYSTADFLPLPTGEYLAWIEPSGFTSTIKMKKE